MESQLKKLEQDQKHRQDYEAHLLRGDMVVRAIFTLVVTVLAIIGFFWVIDNAIVPLVRTLHG